MSVVVTIKGLLEVIRGYYRGFRGLLATNPLELGKVAVMHDKGAIK